MYQRQCGKKPKNTLSSTNVFPFFFPFGLTTPAGIIEFNLGRSSSASVYSLVCFLFRFDGALSGVGLTCLGGGRLASLFLDTREELEEEGLDCLVLSLLVLVLLEGFVGAIALGFFMGAMS